MPERNTATHKMVADGCGYRFLFYCDVSGAHVCTTKEISRRLAVLRRYQNVRICINQ